MTGLPPLKNASGADTSGADTSCTVPEPGTLSGYVFHEPAAQAPRDIGIWHRVLVQSGTLAPEDGRESLHPLSQDMLFGLAGGIGFMVFTFEYAEITTATVVPRFHPGPFVGNLLQRCGAQIREERTTSARMAQRNLDEALDAGRAVVVRVTRGALPWSPGGLEDYDSVDVAVAGRNQAGYVVDDGSGALRTVDPGQLAQARGRRTKDKHWQAHVVSPGTPAPDGLAGLAREAIAGTAAALLATDAPAGIPAHFAKNFGIAGIRTWQERLRDTRTRKGWPAMFADPARLLYGLRRVYESLERDWGRDGGALRGRYGSFLAEVRGLPGLDRLDPGDYYGLGEHWSAFADQVLAYGQVPLLAGCRHGQPGAADFDVADPGFVQWAREHRVEHFAALADTLQGLEEAERAAARKLAAAVGIR
jgi:hypothetical protein